MVKYRSMITYFVNHSKRFVFFIATIAALGGLLFGFDTGVIAGALPFIKTHFHPTTAQEEFIVSATVLGALFGALSSGRLADGLGRRKLLIITALTFIVGTSITALGVNINMLIVGRFILGLAIGAASYTAPLFISEVAPREKRGALVLLNGIAITGGEALSYLIDYYLTGTHNWRLMIAVGIIPAFLLLIGMLFSPNSPRWLFFAGKRLKALDVLTKIRESDQVKKESQEIEASLRLKKGGWKEIFSRKMWPIIIIGATLGILQQFVGINTVMYYGPTIFKQVNFTSAGSQILGTFGLGIVNLIFTIFTIITVDKWGRRVLLMTGTFVAFISLGILGFLITQPMTTFISYLAVTCLITYIAGYAISVGSLFWLIISEIFPLRVRGLGMSFVTALQWGANFLVASTFLTILHGIGSRMTFWLYGTMSLLAFAFTFYFVPETKGVSLEQIERNLSLDESTTPP